MASARQSIGIDEMGILKAHFLSGLVHALNKGFMAAFEMFGSYTSVVGRSTAIAINIPPGSFFTGLQIDLRASHFQAFSPVTTMSVSDAFPLPDPERIRIKVINLVMTGRCHSLMFIVRQEHLAGISIHQNVRFGFDIQRFSPYCRRGPQKNDESAQHHPGTISAIFIAGYTSQTFIIRLYLGKEGIMLRVERVKKRYGILELMDIFSITP